MAEFRSHGKSVENQSLDIFQNVLPSKGRQDAPQRARVKAAVKVSLGSYDIDDDAGALLFALTHLQ